MTTTTKLTRSEVAALAFLREFIDKYGYPPTRRELAEGTGHVSSATGQRLLRNLEAKGAIKVVGSPNRTLRVDILEG
jgi:repressor LexA